MAIKPLQHNLITSTAPADKYEHDTVLVTPEMARRFLDGQHQNRRLSPNLVREYVRAMERDEWLLGPAGLVFDEAGNMLDGQHRCHAIIQYGHPVWMSIARGVPVHVALSAIDAGRGRTTADRLGIDGRPTDARKRVAVARAIAALEFGRISVKLSVDEYDEVIEAVGLEHADAIFKEGRRLTSWVLVGAVLARPLDADLVDSTLRAIVTGTATFGTQGALSRLAARQISGGGNGTNMARAACRGFYLALCGQQTEALKAGSDGYEALLKMRSRSGLTTRFLRHKPEDVTEHPAPLVNEKKPRR